MLGVTSLGFIVGGALVAKFGLGRNPVRTLLLVNVGIALLGMTFAIREWWWLYAVGILVFMCLMPIAEASEQTIVQRVVPFEKQGRVFGFAASVESAAAPVSAFLVGPLAQFWLIPFMNSQEGQDSLGWLLGPGEARGIALAFVGASSLLLIVVAARLRVDAPTVSCRGPTPPLRRRCTPRGVLALRRRTGPRTRERWMPRPACAPPLKPTCQTSCTRPKAEGASAAVRVAAPSLSGARGTRPRRASSSPSRRRNRQAVPSAPAEGRAPV